MHRFVTQEKVEPLHRSQQTKGLSAPKSKADFKRVQTGVKDLVKEGKVKTKLSKKDATTTDKKKQGNQEMYTDSALSKRMECRTDKIFVATARELWNLLPHKNGKIQEDGFKAYCIRLYMYVCPHGKIYEGREMADAEWRTEGKAGGIDFDMWYEGLYQFVDIWCEGATPEEYIDFVMPIINDIKKEKGMKVTHTKTKRVAMSRTEFGKLIDASNLRINEHRATNLSNQEIYEKECRRLGVIPIFAVQERLSSEPGEYNMEALTLANLEVDNVESFVDIMRMNPELTYAFFRKNSIPTAQMDILAHLISMLPKLSSVDISNNPKVDLPFVEILKNSIVTNGNITSIGISGTVPDKYKQQILDQIQSNMVNQIITRDDYLDWKRTFLHVSEGGGATGQRPGVTGVGPVDGNLKCKLGTLLSVHQAMSFDRTTSAMIEARNQEIQSSRTNVSPSMQVTFEQFLYFMYPHIPSELVAKFLMRYIEQDGEQNARPTGINEDTIHKMFKAAGKDITDHLTIDELKTWLMDNGHGYIWVKYQDVIEKFDLDGDNVFSAHEIRMVMSIVDPYAVFSDRELPQMMDEYQGSDSEEDEDAPNKSPSNKARPASGARQSQTHVNSSFGSKSKGTGMHKPKQTKGGSHASSNPAGSKSKKGDKNNWQSTFNVADEMYNAILKVEECKMENLSNRTMYTQEATRLQLPVRSEVVEALSDVPGDYSMKHLTLNGIGLLSILPLMEVILANEELETISLAWNKIDSNDVQLLANVCSRHPGVISLDISGNPGVGFKACNALNQMMVRNTNIVGLRCNHTVPPSFQDKLHNQLRENLYQFVLGKDEFDNLKKVYDDRAVDGKVNMENIVNFYMSNMSDHSEAHVRIKGRLQALPMEGFDKQVDFEELLGIMCPRIPPAMLKKFIEFYDGLSNGSLKMITADDVRKLYFAHDENNDGTLSYEELEAGLTQLGFGSFWQKFEDILMFCDVNKDGMLCIDEVLLLLSMIDPDSVELTPYDSEESMAMPYDSDDDEDDVDDWSYWKDEMYKPSVELLRLLGDADNRMASYFNLSNRQIYLKECEFFGIEPIPGIVQVLSPEPGKFDMRKLPLSGHQIDSINPFVVILRLNADVTDILIKSARLDSFDVEVLSEIMMLAREVRYFDISRNDTHVNRRAVNAIHRLICRCPHITFASIGYTVPLIPKKVIMDQLQTNRYQQQIRPQDYHAVKKVFQTIDEDDGGCIDMKEFINYYREHGALHMSHTRQADEDARPSSPTSAVFQNSSLSPALTSGYLLDRLAMETFLTADKDGDKKISFPELLAALHPKLSPDVVDKFIEMYETSEKSHLTIHQIEKLFEHLDTDGNQQLSIEELEVGFKANGWTDQWTAIKPLLKEFDLDGDGQYGLDETVLLLATIDPCLVIKKKHKKTRMDLKELGMGAA